MATRPTPAKPKAKPEGKAPAKPRAKAEKPDAAAKAPRPAKDGALRTHELIEAIAPNITVKRKDIRTALDAAFKAMSDALAEGKVLNLPPLGKLSVKRTKTGEKSDMVVLKLRRSKVQAKVPGQAAPKGAPADNDSLADDDE